VGNTQGWAEANSGASDLLEEKGKAMREGRGWDKKTVLENSSAAPFLTGPRDFTISHQIYAP